MAQRLAATFLLALQLTGQRLAIGEGIEPFLRRLCAIEGSSAAIVGGELAIRGGLRTALGRAAALACRPDDRVGARVVADVVLLRDGGIELGHRGRAGSGGVVASPSGGVAVVGDRVAPVGSAQPQPGDVVAAASGMLALAGRALADVVAELVGARIDAVGEIAIACGLIAIGGPLVLVGTRLVAVSVCLIGIQQGLVAVGERLLGVGESLRVGDRARIRAGAALQSLDPPVRGARGRIA